MQNDKQSSEENMKSEEQVVGRSVEPVVRLFLFIVQVIGILIMLFGLHSDFDILNARSIIISAIGLGIFSAVERHEAVRKYKSNVAVHARPTRAKRKRVKRAGAPF